MANIRVKDLPNTNSAADTDEFIIDSSTAGTRRLSYSELKSEISTDFQGDVNTYKIATLASDNKLDPSQIPDTLSQGLNFVGVANSASDLTSTTQGDFYVIQTAFDSYQVGDQAVYNGSSYTRVTDGTKQIAEGGTGATTLDAAKGNLEIADVGTAPNEVPLNGQLGTMAFQDASGVSVGQLEVTDKITTKDVGGVTKGQVEFQDSSYTISGGSNLGDIRQDAPRHRFYSGSTILAQIDETTSYFQNTSLGIGTASPSAGAVGGKVVHVQSSGETASVRVDRSDASTAGTLSLTAGNSTLGVYGTGSKPIAFSTNGSEVARLDDAGRLGIGKTPGVKLDVMDTGDSIKADFTNNVNANFRIKTSGANTQIGPSTASNLELQTGNTTRATIDTSGNMTLHAGSLTIGTAGKGIYFGATSDAAGMTAELLDDYEEGTWTPTYTPAVGSFAALTMDVVHARYVKVGSLVHLEAYIRTDNVDTTGASGSLKITGLPFAVAEHTSVNVGYSQHWTNMPLGGNANSSGIYFTKRATTNSDAATVVVSDMTNGSSANVNRAIFTVSYYTTA